MKHRISFIFGVLCSLSILLSALPSIDDCVPVHAEDSGTYRTTDVEVDTLYEVESDGAPFYLSFSRMAGATNAELARFTYALKEANLASLDGGEIGLFVSDKSHVNSYDSLLNRYVLEGSALDEIKRTNRVTSLISFAYSSSNTGFIVRNGIADYTQAGCGEYHGTNDDDTRYGIYFSGIKGTVSFLSLFKNGLSYTLHYATGVTVTTEDDDGLDADIEVSDGVSLYNGQANEMLRHSYFFKDYSFVAFQVEASSREAYIAFDGVYVNDLPFEGTVTADNGIYYFGITLQESDRLSLRAKRVAVTSETDVDVYHLADVAGKKLVSFTQPQNATYGLGNLPNRPNTVFRFLLHTPKAPWLVQNGTKFGLFSSGSSLWSNFGYVVNFYNGHVSLLTGEEIKLGQGDSTLIQPDSTLLIELGLVQSYDEAGYYFADCLYASVNGTVVAVAYDTRRQTLGSVITGPYFDNSDGACSFEDDRGDALKTITDVSTDSHASSSFPTYVEQGNTYRISLLPDEGYGIEHFLVNGEDKTSSLIRKDDTYIYESTMEGDVSFSYTTIPLSTQQIHLANNGDYLRVICPETVMDGDSLTVSLSLSRGKRFSSMMVEQNGKSEDLISSLQRDGKNFLLTLPSVTSDVTITPSIEEGKVHLVSASENTHCTIKLFSEEAGYGEEIAFQVKPEEGYAISGVSLSSGDLEDHGWYFKATNLFEDADIAVETTPLAVEASQETNSSTPIWTLVFVIVSALLFVGSLVLFFLRRKKGGEAAR